VETARAGPAPRSRSAAAIRSNGGLAISGHDDVREPKYYGGPNGWSASIPGANNTFDGSTGTLTGTIYVAFRRLGISGSSSSIFTVLLEATRSRPAARAGR
jgi:hypothetical protein